MRHAGGGSARAPRRELCLLELLLLRGRPGGGEADPSRKALLLRREAGVNAIEIYVHRLRKKLEPSGIHVRTIRGLGYLLRTREGPFSLRYQLLRWLLLPLGPSASWECSWRGSPCRARSTPPTTSRSSGGTGDFRALADGGARPEWTCRPSRWRCSTPSIRIASSIRLPTAPPTAATCHDGYDDLPRPAAAPPGKALFYDATTGKTNPRDRAFHHHACQPPWWESRKWPRRRGRQGLIQTILVQALGQQLLLIVLGAAIVWIGVTRGLSLLQKLSGEVARRSAIDLAPLTLRHAPEEVSPLIGAITS